ncbi:hypothetical protein DFQ28_011493 [Apophysomyces sp. BC1034]|nr:hypothetical protein DFQ30_011168 [Apophysomyces sp. BC1015]KAG0181132.1 hypothetical protein DFQ29_009291 [Apophysomyces sp. BC1021]KAG0191580.1 hypothetical protein DFQ28_011493 [Apophysomyces sp. BC1034]
MSNYTHYPDQARVGRDKQVYDADHVRQVAGCIVIEPRSNRILLVTSSKHQGVWVFPKGGWENDETQEQAAERETYEEAGVRGKITKLVGNFLEYDMYDNPKNRFWLYEFHVHRVMDKWPEMTFRKRQWFTFNEAIHALRFKPLLQRALSQSSLAPEQTAKSN